MAKKVAIALEMTDLDMGSAALWGRLPPAWQNASKKEFSVAKKVAVAISITHS